MATLIQYPDGHPESTSCDGATRVDGSGAAWSTARALSNGTADSPSDATAGMGYSNGSTNQWKFRRMFYLFDTSAIGAGATVTAATLSLVYVNKSDDNTDAFAVCGSATPASNTDIDVADFDQLGTTKFSDEITIDNINADSSTYNVFTLNAAGIAVVDVSGITKLGMRAKHDLENNEPSWGDPASSVCNTAMAEETLSGDKRPKLTVTYTPAFTPRVIVF
jgi:hypothetical protein